MNDEMTKLADMISVLRDGTIKKVTSDNITAYKVGPDLIRIDIKEEK